MSLSLYDASIPVLRRALLCLSAILDKAKQHAETHDMTLQSLVEARLAPDMFALNRQVQSASDAAKGCAARLTDTPPVSFPDTETTFPELQERIAKTVRYLDAFTAKQFEGADERTVTLKMPSHELSFTANDYLLTFALPNFFFHITTAYDILRHQGVPIGKMDYLGQY